jgi:alkanesulfonate monooxygenase SsuD/methylene tetrahydromethanopterin reductase-like flavin-dependent oxidoreductase (luciferase family)
VTVDDARLYTLPPEPPLLLGAAVSEQTAEWLGSWADGLITTGRPKKEMQSMMDAFQRGGGAGKPVFVQHVMAWHPDEAEAKRSAHEQWRFSALEPAQIWDLRTPAAFAAATRHITPSQLAEKIPVSSRLDYHLRLLADYAELDVTRVFCFNACRNQAQYVDAFGSGVLPRLR